MNLDSLTTKIKDYRKKKKVVAQKEGLSRSHVVAPVVVIPAKGIRTGCPDAPSNGFVSHAAGSSPPYGRLSETVVMGRGPWLAVVIACKTRFTLVNDCDNHIRIAHVGYPDVLWSDAFMEAAGCLCFEGPDEGDPDDNACHVSLLLSSSTLCVPSLLLSENPRISDGDLLRFDGACLAICNLAFLLHSGFVAPLCFCGLGVSCWGRVKDFGMGFGSTSGQKMSSKQKTTSSVRAVTLMRNLRQTERKGVPGSILHSKWHNVEFLNDGEDACLLRKLKDAPSPSQRTI
ncbi:hypothetical protein CK203_105066 [Vitis vinifera]|uniref:Uncharacterized protein n=1 Tax=Vitis vinifera TaxID=29760 RepID=A0A438FED3_VITVI|nr:hypothetical protein CK203_105066 [Vitis vinifera]